MHSLTRATPHYHWLQRNHFCEVVLRSFKRTHLIVGRALAVVLVCNEKRIRLIDPDAEVRMRSGATPQCAARCARNTNYTIARARALIASAVPRLIAVFFCLLSLHCLRV